MDPTTDLAFLAGLPAHQAILARALAHYLPDERVLGVMLYGSLALGQGDQFSDIDLNLLVEPEHQKVLLAEAPAATRQFGRPLYGYYADHLNPSQYNALYDDFVKLDLDFVLPGALSPYAARRHHRVFKDATGELATVIAQSAAMPAVYAPATAEVVALDQRFWPWCHYVASKARRGELWEAHAALGFMREWTLTRLAAWLEGVRPTGYRRIESRLSPAWLDGWQETLATPDPASLQRALAALVAVYRRLRDTLAVRMGLRFELSDEQTMVARLQALGVPLAGLEW